jgi:hypothetical protein
LEENLERMQADWDQFERRLDEMRIHPYDLKETEKSSKPKKFEVQPDAAKIICKITYNDEGVYFIDCTKKVTITGVCCADLLWWPSKSIKENCRGIFRAGELNLYTMLVLTQLSKAAIRE